MKSSLNRLIVMTAGVATVILAGFWLFTQPDTLIVYCSHDEVYAQSILDEFTRNTGIPVQPRFDTEATKSLGLIQLILQERHQPRCDVFWNNELLGMVELKEQELLEAYQGSGWRRMPDQYRDQDGYWVGFAARLRVNIFNVRKVKPSDNTLEELLLHAPSRVVMAKPLFGTTLTQYTIMWHLWGPDTLKEWHHDLRSRGLREVNGNAAVKDVVATGACDAGLTDTDDFFVAVDDQQPVEMSAVRILRSGPVPQPLATGTRQESAGYTICVPNTVGIIKGTKRRNAAQRLVDFLASAETEMSLARAKSRQIPLGSVDEAQLPADVRQMKEWCRDGIELRSLLPARRDCLKWLQSEYLK